MIEKDYFDWAVRKGALIKAQIKLLEEDYKETMKSLGDLEFRKYPAGGYILEVQHNRAFSPKLAKELLSKEEYASILAAPKPDPAKAKALVGAEDYELLMADYPVPYKFVIKEVTDA